MSWLDSLRKTLDLAPKPITFFFRDDDAGWEDQRLFKLVAIFDQHNVPLDLAVIPESISGQTAARLRTVVEINPQRVSLHQHGYAHVNHEQSGRKCEFGESRPADSQLADITSGWQLLKDLFGSFIDPIFTPPWNRCTATTAECLREAGFRYLSRDVTASEINTGGLSELPIAIDWFKQRHGFRLAPNQLGVSISTAARERKAVGVMLHHAVMDEEERSRLSELLRLVSTHSQVRCVLMRDLIHSTSQGRT